MQNVIFKDLGNMDYGQAWDYQEVLLQENVRIKTEIRQRGERAVSGVGEVGVVTERREGLQGSGASEGLVVTEGREGRQRSGAEGNERPVTHDDLSAAGLQTTHYLLFVEHPPVYTLGKSGDMQHVLIDDAAMQEKGAQFFKTNRGGDITFHGPGQIVGYPILDLEKFYTDIGKYLRNLEEMVIRLLAGYGIEAERSPGETGVWIEPGVKGRERKICAIGVRCSRWVTMHGFALNVNTDLSYFGNIVPCGIQGKQVTSLEKELGYWVPVAEVKERLKEQFEMVFGVELSEGA